MIKFLAHKSGSTLISANGFVDVPSRTVFSLDDHVLESGLFDEFISRGILKVFQTVETASAWLAEEDLAPVELPVNSTKEILAAVTTSTEVVSAPAPEAAIIETAGVPANPTVEAPAAPLAEEVVTSEVTEAPPKLPVTPVAEVSPAEVPDPDAITPARKTRAKQG